MMEKRKAGRRPSPDALKWRTVVHLTPPRAAKLERLARREELPVATVARRLLSERLDEVDDGQPAR